MNPDESLSASLEHYLEAIFHIESKKQAARAKDIGERLQVKGASVTAALRILAQKKLINYAPYDLITLTTKGRAIAENIVHRHATLQHFLVNVLAIDEKEAEKAACKIEHDISNTVVERLTQFIKFLEACPLKGKGWLKGFSDYCEHGKKHDQCERCLLELVDNFNAHKNNTVHTSS